MSLTELQESLLILNALRTQIEWALKAMVPAERVQDEDLKFTVCNHILILVCSFLDEWKIFGSLGASEASVRNVRKVASPALDRIQKWSGLAKVRSTVLAHGHRDKRGAPAWTWEIYSRYAALTAYAEVILLGNCVLMAVKAALDMHLKEYLEAAAQITPRDIEDKGVRNVREINEELQEILDAMGAIKSTI